MSSSAWGERPVLQLSSFEEVDVLSIEAEDFENSPLLSPAYEQPLEVITLAVSK